ncbi:serine/threonine-protein kinase pelle-like [Ctenocephalides felis]|uniref:serine/threonine-protein kinase pelle-like n=2 Tax=Ctenocephalides felis TaxID=7515 RepID=UPI000E6E5A99|nr:serine/threonine-protein kinase pelle-like [Ctenocephalides felis]
MMSNGREHKYIYNMFYSERLKLCRLLDENEKWKELAGHMQFDVCTVQDIERKTRCGGSPSDELLTLWGRHNHTILELFILLSRMNHFKAMEEIKQSVDPRYHQLIKSYEEHLCTNFAQLGPRQINGNARNSEVSDSDNVAVITKSSKILNVLKPKQPNIVVQIESINNNNNAQTSDENNENVLTPPTNRSHQMPFQRRLSPQPQAKFLVSGVSDISSINESASAIPRISYDELQAATDNWNESNVLGRGGFGKVFKGLWKNTAVAIKRLEPPRGMTSAESYNTQMEQSMRELRYLNGCRHDNILSLYGYSMDEGREPCLVYQYMSGGSLERNFQRARHNLQPSLLWQQRKNIARGTARGLQFLHTYNREKPLIHGDIKSANILLDQCNEPRIGDFGLAREGPHTDYMKVTRIQGTRPYLPDEFLRGRKLSTKVDTYSFGVVLFEIATGLSVYDDKRKYKFLKDHVTAYCEEGQLDALQDLRSEDSSSHEAKNIFAELIKLGLICVNRIPNQRPEMVKVLELLE